MRIITYSLIAIATVGAVELKHAGQQYQQIAGVDSANIVDANVVGSTISTEHVARWEARNRIQKISNAPRVYEQAFPGDVDLTPDENSRFAGEIDMMPTGSIKKSATEEIPHE